MVWRDRGLGFLATRRLDVCRLVLRAEKQPPAISEDAEGAAATAVGFPEEIEQVSCFKTIIAHALLIRARACGAGRGLELRQRLRTEWEGSATKVIAAKARKYQPGPASLPLAAGSVGS